MKKLGCSQFIIIFAAVCIVFTVVIYFLVNPMIENMTADVVVKELGKYSSEEKYYSKQYEDYVCYRKYIFDSVESDKLKNSQFLKEITEEDFEILNEYETNFSNWIQKHAVDGYDFDMSMADKGDYYYIDSERDPQETPDSERKYMQYKMYIYDRETKTVYHFQYDRDLSR